MKKATREAILAAGESMAEMLVKLSLSERISLLPIERDGVNRRLVEWREAQTLYKREVVDSKRPKRKPKGKR